MAKRTVVALVASLVVAGIVFLLAPVHIDTDYGANAFACPSNSSSWCNATTIRTAQRTLGKSTGAGTWAWALRAGFYAVSSIHMLGSTDYAKDVPRLSDLVRNGIAAVGLGSIAYVLVARPSRKRPRGK